MSDVLQDPRVAALLKAIDAPAENYGIWFEVIQNARAAFIPPVEYEYTMPCWGEITGRDDITIISKYTYMDKREATKRPKPKQEKLGREWWVNYYADGIGSIWNTKKQAEKACDVDGKTLIVREVLE